MASSFIASRRTPGGPGSVPYDLGRLEKDLRDRVSGEVRFDTGSIALYTQDSSNYREVPLGVVIPYDVEAIAAAVAVCRDHDVPVLHRGGGTSLAGQCTNNALVIDGSKYCRKVIEIDPERRIAKVEPGTRLDELRDAANAHGLTFGPDPATHEYNTLGGMIGNNSGGVHSVIAGTTVDNVEDLEIVTYDGLRMTVGPTSEEELAGIIAAGGRRGEIYRGLRDLRDRYADAIRRRYTDIPRRVSGYSLDQLLPECGFHVARALVGSEGTCVTVLRATLRLISDPPKKVLLAVGFDSVFHAADAVPAVRAHGPRAIEGIDELLVENMRTKHLLVEDLKELPGGKAWLIVQFGGETVEEAVAQAQRLAEDLRGNRDVRDTRLLKTPEEQQRIWDVREAGLGATAFVPGMKRDSWPGWEDSAVRPDQLGSYIRELKDLYDRYDYHGSMYGHFGDGLIHSRIDFGLHTRADVDRFRRFMFDAARLVARYGGTLSGEHGDGQARAELLPICYGEELVRGFEAFKAIWDPRNRMNPGRVVHPRPLDVDLRLGPRFKPPKVETVFSYAGDGFSFARATQRCVGVSKCRRLDGGTMCPSYRATHEERHTTRGRAHMLQEMLQGDPVRKLWRSDAVREALDLCLSCKGCRSDCPVNVDMATYKAEFLHHYYKGRLRPRAAYAMGEIHLWARLLEPVAGLVNLFTQTPGLKQLPNWVAGIHPARTPPAFAMRSFRRSYRPNGNGRGDTRRDGPLVVLWTDTFNNHFTPGPLHAAAEVLEAAGCRVELPRANLCCGRPLYDYGLLGQAKRTLRRTMAGLREQLDRGAYVVGVEPSCLATFRDELPNLFPKDAAARRLAGRAMLFGEFLDKVLHYDPPGMQGRAILRAHCNHKSVFGVEHDKAVLGRTGLDFEWLDDNCCGMAGAFGYEVRKYGVSLRIAEDVTLPAIRMAPPETRIVCDGFSCREQIRQLAGREVVTLPELICEGLRKGGKAGPRQSAERRPRKNLAPAALAAIAGLALGAAAGLQAGR